MSTRDKCLRILEKERDDSVREDKMRKYRNQDRLGSAESQKASKEAVRAFRHKAYTVDMGKGSDKLRRDANG